MEQNIHLRKSSQVNAPVPSDEQLISLRLKAISLINERLSSGQISETVLGAVLNLVFSSVSNFNLQNAIESDQ